MKLRYLAVGLILAAGCSGKSTEDEPTAASELERKRAAANEVASGAATSDPCADNDWYGDSVCDSFCADADTDCVVGAPDGPTVCAQFIENEDGVCSRPEGDPCIYQDPDCGSGPPDDGVACALLSEVADGECTRPDDDPCRFQDPDCQIDGPGGSYNCDLSQVACEMAEPTCADGEVPTASGLCYGPCVPKEWCADDGGAVCLQYIEESDGACSRPADDPCKFQDPDCSDDGGVVCAAYIEESDGVCSRPADDPCRSQDPDCTEDGVACADYIEESDGKCGRQADDPCIFQDPDCK